MNYNELKGTGIPKFPANSRVCFLGDSLTSGSLWVHMIFDQYLKLCPEDSVRIYDCGIGGGTAGYGLARLEDDLYTYEPTHVVIMYGENDIKGAAGSAEEKAEAFYRNMKKLADTLVSRGLTIYFMSEPARELEGGEIDVRELSSVVMNRLADEFDTVCVDLFKIYSPLMKEGMAHPDKIHITPLGGSMLARVFLHLQGFDGFTPDDEGFFDMYGVSYDLDHRMIFNEKIRTVRLAERNISTLGDTTEAKIERLYRRLETRADGAWDDFCYYRAIDFIERYPHMKFYREELDRTTEKMIADALNG